MNKRIDKSRSRLKRAMRTRSKIKELHVPRICVFRSSQHIYAQLVSPCGERVLTSASTLEESIGGKMKHCGNKEAAEKVGREIAKRVKEQGIKKVAFDRSGYKFHGCVKALADAAREEGVEL